ncbi:Zn-dependent exopeptidase [Mycena olivaceomarginata]|nr:Zn-dependent exopeptidase [Mycena olivaceomarginata]
MIPLAGALLLVVPFAPSLFDTCLSSNYYGNYNDGPTPHSIFLPDAACLDLWSSQTLAPSASISEAKHAIQQLVWVEQEAVDSSLIAATRSFRPEFDSFLQRLTAPKRMGRDQDVLVAPEREMMGYELLYQTPTAALLSVSESTARTIDMLLPRFWKSSLVSTTPVDFLPVPDKAVKHVKEVLANLRFNPDVAAIVDSISTAFSGIVSRHSFAEGSRVAASWLKARFEETGATCELQPFLQGFAPNVICAYPSTVNTTATVLLSAHYDSRDDDGSGTMAILAIARTIARKGIKFQSNVQLAAFAGEEQGLLGSRAYARKLRDIDANITVMIQADMLAYRKQGIGEPPQLGLPFTIGTTEVTQLVANVSAIYSPELKVGFTAACCSDHQSFHEQGFPATQVFERAGDSDRGPMYHNSGDLSDREGYDFGQVKSIAKVQLATLLHAAGYELPSESN